ncbi:MAG: hypothetical protein ABIJ48_11765 [Actinomycetota bacterium]
MTADLRRALAGGALVALALAAALATRRRRRPAPAPGTWQPLEG